MAAKLVKAVVAPRKTVVFEGKYVGPGTEISLAADEVAELRGLGFLVDPEAPEAPAAGEGPKFGPVDEGPTVTVES
jgi:hypothetical protein